MDGGPYTNFEWSNGETDSTITVSQSGNYAVTVSNTSGCTADTSIAFSISQSPVASISAMPYDCNGVVTLIGAGGNAYLWSNGETTDSITVQSNGDYTVTVTNALGCTDSAVETVGIPTAPQVSISGSTALCMGASGNLTASIGFGQYLWSNGETISEISVSQPGIYYVTVTDNIGCTATTSQSIISSPSPEPEVSGSMGFCENGSATLQINQSFAQMIWSNGSATQNITVSQPATYTVTVTNVAGCTDTDEWAVTEYALPTVTITGPTLICSGSSADFSVPSSFLQINWSTGETTSGINVSTVGIYQITVTDANGCTAEDAIELEIVASLTPVIAMAATSCNGDVTFVEQKPPVAKC